MKKYIYKGMMGSSNHITFNGITYNFKIDGVCNYEGEMAKLIDLHLHRFEEIKLEPYQEEVIDSIEVLVKPKIEDIMAVLQKDDVEAFAKLDDLDITFGLGAKSALEKTEEETIDYPIEETSIETLDEVIEKNDVIDEVLKTEEDTIIIDEVPETKIEEINNIVDEPNKSEIYLKDLHWTKLKKLAVLFNIEYTTKEETISKLKNLPIEKLMS